MLASLIPDIDSSNVIMVTSCLGTSDADDFMTVASGQHGGGGSSELILCVDESLYVTDDEAAENGRRPRREDIRGNASDPRPLGGEKA